MKGMGAEQETLDRGMSYWGQIDSTEVAQPSGRAATDDKQEAFDRAGRRARGLGWFSIGMGTAQLLAPRGLSRLIGVGDGPGRCLAMRASGARTLLAGIGILNRPTSGWLWARVAGDVMDLALLKSALGTASPSKRRGRVPLAILAVAGVTALDVLTSRQLRRGKKEGLGLVTETARPTEILGHVTINKTSEEVYAFWRDLRNLSRFMTNVKAVQVLDRARSRWTVDAAGKKLEWEATITDDRANELIAWRALENADVANTGEVRFTRAPGGRGTEVHVKMEVMPPGGALGRVVAKLVHKIPEQQMENDLRRLKQVLETGEVVHSDASVHDGPHPARPSLKRV